MPVAVVTDSTAYLDEERCTELGVRVVPLHVVVDGRQGAEGEDGGAADRRHVADALRRGRAVTTSRPSPAALVAAYEAALEGGADAVVAVHLSAELSGTVEAARLAAAEVRRSRGAPVEVVDSRLLGMALGLAVEAAALAARAGRAAEEVAAAARARAAGTRGWLCVDTLEHLRRGGRITSAQALIGTALAVKPLLELRDGQVVPFERVRTSSRALARLAELATAAASEGPSELVVQHLAAADRAAELAERLAPSTSAPVRVVEVGVVVGAHVGPGMVGAVVARQVDATGALLAGPPR